MLEMHLIIKWKMGSDVKTGVENCQQLELPHSLSMAENQTPNKSERKRNENRN